MEEDGTAILAYEDTEDIDEEYPVNHFGTVTASIQTACLLEPLPVVYGIPQTKVTFVARVDMKGVIPTIFKNRLVEMYFSNLSKLRLKFERDHEINGTSRAAIRKRIKATKGYHAINFSGRFADMKGKVRDTFMLLSNRVAWIQPDNFLFMTAHKVLCIIK